MKQLSRAKKATRILFVTGFLILFSSALPSANLLCKSTACEVYGKVKFVEYGEDYKVKRVDYGEDVRIKWVDYGENKKGLWKRVDYGEKVKLKWVNYGEDFTIKEVRYGEGC